MNAPHPIRALHGHLATIAPSLDAIPFTDPMAMHDRGFASGELGCAMSMLDQAVSALVCGAWHLDRAVGKGGGASYDLTALANIRSRLAEAVAKIDGASANLSDKLAGAR